MIFRQLFEPLSSTYKYLLGCEETRQAVLIDPPMPEWRRDLAVVNSRLECADVAIEEGRRSERLPITSS